MTLRAIARLRASLTADNRLDDAQRRALVLPGLEQGQRILGKARAAVAGPRVQKLVADAVVEPDAARHVLHVGPGLLAQIGDLVDEGDLRRQKGVGGVFGQFRGAPPDKMQRRLVEAQGAVDFGHHFARARVVGADHHPVGTLKVLDRRALAQKLGVGDHGEIGVRPDLANDPLDLVAGADRHRRFIDDDREAVQRRGDGLGGGENIGEIGVAVAAPRRRADADEHRRRAAHRRAQLGR